MRKESWNDGEGGGRRAPGGAMGTLTFENLGEVAELVRRFEACSLPAKGWNHAARLTVALWYLLDREEWQATEGFIQGLRRYNRVHGLQVRWESGYHETLTLFWLAVARRFLERSPLGMPPLLLINRFLREYGDRPGLVFEHYRKQTLRSQEARYFWVEPDLKPLDPEPTGDRSRPASGL